MQAEGLHRREQSEVGKDCIYIQLATSANRFRQTSEPDSPNQRLRLRPRLLPELGFGGVPTFLITWRQETAIDRVMHESNGASQSSGSQMLGLQIRVWTKRWQYRCVVTP